MTTTINLKPHPPEYERFLYAPVGEDNNGYVVTVLSTLARLGLDPWNETADLVASGRDAARLRLGALLSKSGDVPALEADHGRVADELSLLLPQRARKDERRPAASPVAGGGLRSAGSIWAMLAVFLVLLQILFNGMPGSGN
ncbi:MAG: hypothetical protein GC146_06765 [Limimaricola sp.]|uniref:hypothetical protein n=1 Tax=Limimaricola sp. TaxID=2211665 RepID=UPI001E119437|nr:hypothetical protein [Limimaricola sp.]MBI1416906.1 hypothetical protein [Limimaricola sp.]